MKVLIPDSIPLTLPEISDFEFIRYSTTSTDFSAVQDAELLVMWMNSAENTQAAVAGLKNLKLVQTLAAGADHVLGAGFSPEIAIASGRGLHDKTVAEHALALTLASVRQLDRLKRSQENRHWDHDVVAEQAALESAPLFTLNGAQVLIYGFGSIAHHFAPMLSALGAQVQGVAQQAGERAGFPVVTEAEAAPLLKRADIVISLLPYSSATEKHFNKAFFSGMKTSAIFINVGRGKTVNEDDLIAALSEKIIRRAAIDVTYVEPLPTQSPLWNIPGLIITPHISGGRPQDSESLILRNSQALLRGEPIINLVAR